MNNLRLFENPEFGKIRGVEIDGEPWMVGKDVAEALGYERAAKAIQDHVDDEDKDVVPIQDSIGRMQNAAIINESGLYSLVMSSKLPKAKEFKRWVTSEVLPSIRKHGAYATPQTLAEMLRNPDSMIEVLTALKNEQEQRKQAEAQIEQQKPKVIFADAVATADNTILIGDLAKLIKQNGYDIGQKRLFDWLRENGFLIKRKGADFNSPTQRAMEMGLFEIKESTNVLPDGMVRVNKTTKVTGKGQIYFINKFMGMLEGNH